MAELKGSLVVRTNSKWWYARYKVNGKERVSNLQVAVEGERPSSLREDGDRRFEKSRIIAQAKLDDLIERINRTRTREESAQAVHVARYGERVASYCFDDLSERWLKAPRKSPISDSRRKLGVSRLKQFADYCKTHHPEITDIDFFSPDNAREYMDWQDRRGITASTYNSFLSIMKRAFREAGSSVFEGIVEKEGTTISRKPFSPEELRAILDASQADPFIRPLIVVASSSPLRKGDIATLRWMSDEDDPQPQVNFESGMLSVLTSKTGARVSIPMNDLLYTELKRQEGNGSEYVFPKQADQYLRNPKLLTNRLRKVLATAGFYDGSVTPTSIKLDAYDPAKLREKVKAHIAMVKTPLKRERMKKAFDFYIEGYSLNRVCKILGYNKPTVSGYLNEIQTATGIRFIRGARTPAPELLPPKRGDVAIKRKRGLLKASVRDWHAFRTTWITSQLCAGMSVELLSKATGHTTAKAIEDNYFKPHEAQLKEAFARFLPELVSTSHENPTERALKGLHSINRLMSKAEMLEQVKAVISTLEGGQ